MSFFRGKIETNRYFDFATPYGYGGWIIEGEEVEELFDSYKIWIRNNGIISEFVRFHPIIKNYRECMTFYDIVQLGEVVHMDLSSPEIIWDNIISKNRNMVRKASKNGICIFNGRYPEIYRQFQNIYNKTMDKDNADSYYYFGSDFYNSIMNDLSYNSQVFWAELDGKVIAASIMLFANGRINYHLSGSLREYYSLAPTNLLLYETAMWGYANGFKTLYLGGGVGSGEDNLFKFKRSFYKGNLNRFHIGKQIYDLETYKMLTSLKQNVRNPGYFPEYRG